VKASIFDEYFAGVPSADHYSRQMDPRDIAFQCIGVQRRLSCFRVESHAQALDESKIGMITGQSEYLFRRQVLFTRAILHHDLISCDRFYVRVKQRIDLPRLDSVFDVGPHPILNGLTKFGVAVHESDARAIPIKV
jgi:hypothetical protein